MKKFKILIVGLGQLGSRYLQGILTAGLSVTIDTIEPNDRSFELALSLVGDDSHAIRRVSIHNLANHYDIAIVATSAAIRAELVTQISTATTIDNWVLEKILAQTEKQLDDIAAITAKANGAWVNTPRRRTSIYRALKPSLQAGTPLKLDVSIQNMGLGCNAIHFIDLVSWLSNAEIEHIDIQTLGWQESKRAGYKDFDGTLIATFTDESTLSINSSLPSDNNITLTQSGVTYDINEAKGYSRNANFVEGRVEYQSELTYPLMADILDGQMLGGLPTVPESIIQHKALFSAIRNTDALNADLEKGIPIT